MLPTTSMDNAVFSLLPVTGENISRNHFLSLRSSGQQFSTLFEHLTDKLTNNKLIKTVIERLIDLKRLFHNVTSELY